MAKWAQKIMASRPLKLSISVVMLLMSVIFFADVFKLRGDASSAERDIRKTIAESLAVQLTLLASHGDNVGIKKSIQQYVTRHDELLAAALYNSQSIALAQYGDKNELVKVSARSTSSYISVPIFNKEERWGEVRVVFSKSATRWLEFRYYLFVLLGSFLICYIFLRKVLVQLDPGRVVPQRVNSAFDMFTESVIILDSKMQILIANKAAEGILGQSSDKLLGRQLDLWPWEKEPDWQSPWSNALSTGVNVSDVPLTLFVRGDPRIMITSCSVVGEENIASRGVLVTLNDMTAIEAKNQELAQTLNQLKKSEKEIKAKNRELQTLATRDSLTGLYNRRAFLERFERDYIEAVQSKLPLCCVMTDIDHFKNINDTYGHAVGDDIIKSVAGALLRNTIESDTVGRYGGEEFVVILPGRTTDAALSIAEAMRADIMRVKNSVSVELDSVTSSFGVAQLAPEVENVSELIMRADQALYFAKHSGRNRVIEYNENLIELQQTTVQSKSCLDDDSAVLSRVVELEAIAVARERDLDEMRTHDRLTGIPNRVLFVQRLETELVRAERNGLSVAVISIELREYDNIVSTFGHSATDELVISFVQHIQNALRSTDLAVAVTDYENMSRITTNEYGLVLSDLRTSEQVLPVISRLRRVLREAFTVDNQRIFLGVTLGISLYPKCGDTSSNLLESAGRARVEAKKQAGKFAFFFASDKLDKQSRKYIELETDLHEAVRAGDFSLVYQPKLNLTDYKICGLEALLRWHHPTKGPIPPDKFIEIAESCGLIHDISAFVFNKALFQLRQWYDAGWHELKLSINISALQLRRSDLASEVLAALKKAHIPPSALELEITETSMIESPESAYVILSELRDSGVRVSMDDFGTGYTSLSLLADLPLDCVKIDRSFITEITKAERNKAIVESIITMSHSLKLWVVGEGIEHQDQLELLQKLGCDEIQGYLISVPLAAKDIPEILARYNNSNKVKNVA